MTWCDTSPSRLTSTLDFDCRPRLRYCTGRMIVVAAILSLSQQTTTTSPAIDQIIPYAVIGLLGVDRILLHLKSRGIDLAKMASTLDKVHSSVTKFVNQLDSVKVLASATKEANETTKLLNASIAELTMMIREYRLELKQIGLAVDRVEKRVDR